MKKKWTFPPSVCACTHVCTQYVCMSTVCRKMKHSVIVFMTCQRTARDTGKDRREPEPGSSCCSKSWLNLRVWGSTEGEESQFSTFLLPWAIWYPQTFSGVMSGIDHPCEWWRVGASSLLAASSEAKSICGLLSDFSVWPWSFYPRSVCCCWYSFLVSLSFSS